MAAVTIGIAGRIDVVISEDEVVGSASSRVSSRRPVVALLTSDAELLSVRVYPSAPHEE